MKKILVSGYIGFGNFGDEALLHVLTKNLLSLGIESNNITVPSNNPDLTSRMHKINSINRWSLLNLIEAISSTDSVIFTGGIFQDKTSLKSFLYYFFQLLLAGILGKQIVFYGVGIGPFQRKITHILFEFVIKYVTILTVRDKQSAEFIPFHNNGFVTCDPVWGVEIDTSFQKAISSIKWDMPILGISLRHDRLLKDAFITNLADKIVKVLNGMKDWQVVLVPCMEEEDLTVLYELYSLITKKVAEPNKIVLLDQFSKLPIGQQLGVLASCDALIGMRYHAILSTLLSGHPVFGIVSDPKIKSLIEFSGQVGMTLKDDLEQPWNYFWQNLQYSIDNAKRTRQKALELNQKNNEILKRIL